MKGELHPSKNRLQDKIRYPVPTFLLMDDSANELLFSGVITPESNGCYHITASWVPYHIHTPRCDCSPCAELRFSTPHSMTNSITIMVTAQKNNKRYPGCLSHAVIGMFYSVVANQSQPQYTLNVLQRQCLPRPTIIFFVLGWRGEGGREIQTALGRINVVLEVYTP